MFLFSRFIIHLVLASCLLRLSSWGFSSKISIPSGLISQSSVWWWSSGFVTLRLVFVIEDRNFVILEVKLLISLVACSLHLERSSLLILRSPILLSSISCSVRSAERSSLSTVAFFSKWDQLCFSERYCLPSLSYSSQRITRFFYVFWYLIACLSGISGLISPSDSSSTEDLVFKNKCLSI